MNYGTVISMIKDNLTVSNLIDVCVGQMTTASRKVLLVCQVLELVACNIPEECQCYVNGKKQGDAEASP